MSFSSFVFLMLTGGVDGDGGGVGVYIMAWHFMSFFFFFFFFGMVSADVSWFAKVENARDIHYQYAIIGQIIAGSPSPCCSD
jgi:hypothetical protein